MAHHESCDDETLVIDAIREGDRYAFSELVRRHDRWVRGVVYGVLGSRDLVDDVVQQVWASVWQRIGDLQDSRRWRAWIYRLARHTAIDSGREVTRRRKHLQSLAWDAASKLVTPSSGEPEEREDRHRQVLCAIEGLPPLYREPFVLRHLSGWSYRQIAELMSMPIDTVETRLVRARRLLRQALSSKG